MPFTQQQFFEVFRNYNTSIYPSQIILLLFGIYAIFNFHKRDKFVLKYSGAILTLIWLWIGMIYHILYFSKINKAAYLFGAIFIVQAIFFFVEFRIKKRILIEPVNMYNNITGYFFMIFGAIIYPTIGLINGKGIEYTISFGLPCPSVIYTFGLLILLGKSSPKYLYIIPTIWAIIGLFAAINFGVYQDILLPISAITGIILSYKK